MDVVIVDDIAGSGRTLSLARTFVLAQGARNAWLTATFQNVDNATGAIPDDLVVARKVAQWVVFPWEKQPS